MLVAQIKFTESAGKESTKRAAPLISHRLTVRLLAVSLFFPFGLRTTLTFLLFPPPQKN